MGIRDAIIITILLSQSLCDARGNIAGTLLQGLLSSNPHLAKMLSNKLMQANTRPYYNGPILNRQAQVSSLPVTSIQSSLPRSSTGTPVASVSTASNGQYVPVYQNYQKSQYSQAKIEYPQNQVYQVQTKENVPKEVQYQAQYAQPVYSTVQQTSAPVSYTTQTTQTSYPAVKPNPFVSPAPMVNPFLPAASPISALCPPTSSLLPPAIPSLARSQFLRKVPIPPPCL